MTKSQINRLRLSAEEEKANRCGEARFANAIASIQPTPENLQKLIARCSNDSTNLERRAAKLLYWINARGYRLGLKIETPVHVTCLSELTPDEIKMSNARFQEEWRVKKVFKHLNTVLPGEKRCANKWCRKGPDKGRGIVPPRSRGGFCSQTCRDVSKPPVMTLAETQISERA